LFCFHQKKSAADAHRIICETYGENVIAIPQRIGLSDLKKLILMTKNRMLCSCGRGRIAERWEKVVRNDGKYFD